MKEEIVVCTDQKAEQLAHEVAMLYVKECFHKYYQEDLIIPDSKEEWIIHQYCKSKERALDCLLKDYEFSNN